MQTSRTHFRIANRNPPHARIQCTYISAGDFQTLLVLATLAESCNNLSLPPERFYRRSLYCTMYRPASSSSSSRVCFVYSRLASNCLHIPSKREASKQAQSSLSPFAVPGLQSFASQRWEVVALAVAGQTPPASCR